MRRYVVALAIPLAVSQYDRFIAFYFPSPKPATSVRRKRLTSLHKIQYRNLASELLVDVTELSLAKGIQWAKGAELVGLHSVSHLDSYQQHLNFRSHRPLATHRKVSSLG